jgi:hypothetical protein
VTGIEHYLDRTVYNERIDHPQHMAPEIKEQTGARIFCKRLTSRPIED